MNNMTASTPSARQEAQFKSECQMRDPLSASPQTTLARPSTSARPTAHRVLRVPMDGLIRYVDHGEFGVGSLRWRQRWCLSGPAGRHHDERAAALARQDRGAGSETGAMMNAIARTWWPAKEPAA